MGIIESLGKFHSIATPGLACFCFPFANLVGKLSTSLPFRPRIRCNDQYYHMQSNANKNFGKGRASRPSMHALRWSIVATGTRVQQLDVSCVTKTLDNVTVTLQIAVQYRVINGFVPGADTHSDREQTPEQTPACHSLLHFTAVL